jgi:hypothetical protein
MERATERKSDRHRHAAGARPPPARHGQSTGDHVTSARFALTLFGRDIASLCVLRHPLQATLAGADPHRTHEHSHRTSRASSKIPHDLPAVLITTPPSWARQHGARCFSFVKLPSSDLLSSSSGSWPLVREVSCRARTTRWSPHPQPVSDVSTNPCYNNPDTDAPQGPPWWPLRATR